MYMRWHCDPTMRRASSIGRYRACGTQRWQVDKTDYAEKGLLEKTRQIQTVGRSNNVKQR